MNVRVSLEALLATASPLHVALTDVFCLCLKETLNEFSYYADCAGKLRHLFQLLLCCAVLCGAVALLSRVLMDSLVGGHDALAKLFYASSSSTVCP